MNRKLLPEFYLDMIKTGRVQCPICPAEWEVDMGNENALKLIEEAVKTHAAEHNRIAVTKSS
jgi:hypothetical protein